MNEQILYNRPTFPAQLNMAHPLTRGLQGCWLLNETGGMRAWDSSPYKRHGTLGGFTAPVKHSYNGLLFDGSDDQVNLNQSLEYNDKTVLAWFFPFTAMAGRGFIWMSPSNFNGNPNEKGSSLSFLSSQLEMRVATGAGDQVTIDIPITVLNQWHFGGMRHSVTASKLWGIVDDTITTSSAITGYTANTSNSAIGWTSTSFNGLIAMVLYYNIILSDNDIKNLYMNPYDMFLR